MQKGLPLTEERVRFLWQQAVLPYLEEHYLDDPDSLEALTFDQLFADVSAAPPDSSDTGEP